jgi:hypothetical protein
MPAPLNSSCSSLWRKAQWNNCNQGFFGPRTAVENVYAAPVALQVISGREHAHMRVCLYVTALDLSQYFKAKSMASPVVVSPDAGGVKRAKVFRDGLAAVGVDADLAMIIKQRVKADGETNQAVGQVRRSAPEESMVLRLQSYLTGAFQCFRWIWWGTSMAAIASLSTT